MKELPHYCLWISFSSLLLMTCKCHSGTLSFQIGIVKTWQPWNNHQKPHQYVCVCVCVWYVVCDSSTFLQACCCCEDGRVSVLCVLCTVHVPHQSVAGYIQQSVHVPHQSVAGYIWQPGSQALHMACLVMCYQNCLWFSKFGFFLLTICCASSESTQMFGLCLNSFITVLHWMKCVYRWPA